MKDTGDPIRPHPNPWRRKLYEILFETETPFSKQFDVALLLIIFLSVLVVIVESITSIRIKHGDLLHQIEWGFTFIFTIEYTLRLLAVQKKHRYIFSFFGIVDFVSVIPTYLALFMTGAQSLLVIRALRLLRVFRVLKLGRYLTEFQILIKAIKATKDKIFVFLMIVLNITVVMGTMMYLIEGAENGFTSIPKSIYWAIVTMTTVGYGDISPKTDIGQVLASIVMIIGYAIIVVPTGIFSVELFNIARQDKEDRRCQECDAIGHETDAIYCRYCGAKLNSTYH